MSKQLIVIDANQMKHAYELIGERDPTDIDLLALTLKLKSPLWSRDRDFQNIENIIVVTTDDLLAAIAEK